MSEQNPTTPKAAPKRSRAKGAAAKTEAQQAVAKTSRAKAADEQIASELQTPEMAAALDELAQGSDEALVAKSSDPVAKSSRKRSSSRRDATKQAPAKRNRGFGAGIAPDERIKRDKAILAELKRGDKIEDVAARHGLSVSFTQKVKRAGGLTTPGSGRRGFEFASQEQLAAAVSAYETLKRMGNVSTIVRLIERERNGQGLAPVKGEPTA